MDLTNLPIIYIPEIKEEHIIDYGNVSNDFNPLHFDKKAAEQAGFPSIIAHGMMTMGISTKLISPWLSNDYFISEYESSFHKPLLVGDSLHLVAELIKQQETYARISFKGVNQDRKTIITGKILVKSNLT
ncbi:MaoC family dehydratase [Halalkalibacter alkalisediminis]|uniref:MaoC family dehydratase n=1 Tax=Halalkalibacter alkalisediminis TaxID=935616 RepID=A0ABV6NN35_9BACI|nr:MaoC/PaaZ C-terminal domain-containing protein [Halalkalibacter alkalisediminis]